MNEESRKAGKESTNGGAFWVAIPFLFSCVPDSSLAALSSSFWFHGLQIQILPLSHHGFELGNQEARKGGAESLNEESRKGGAFWVAIPFLLS